MHIGDRIGKERERELPLLVHEEMHRPCARHLLSCQPHGVEIIGIGVVGPHFVPVHIWMRHLRVILQVSAIPKAYKQLVEVFLLLLFFSDGKRIDSLRLILIPVLRIFHVRRS